MASSPNGQRANGLLTVPRPRPKNLYFLPFAILPASNAAYIDSISIASKGDSRKRAKGKGKVKNPLRIIFPDIYFLATFGHFALWSRSKASLQAGPLI